MTRSLPLLINILACVCSALCLTLGVPTADAQERLLSNDSFDRTQMGRIGSAQLVDGEMYAATFTIPQAWLPVELLGVQVVMVDGDQPGVSYCGRWSIEVFEEPANRAPTYPPGCFLAQHIPAGPTIYSMSTQFQNNPIGFEVKGDSSNFQELRFASINNNPQLMVTIPPVMLNRTSVRVGIKALDNQCSIQAGDDYPVMLTDNDGTIDADNFVYGYPKGLGGLCPQTSYFYLWSDFQPFFMNSQPGDFVMRLILDRQTTPPPMDMGGGMLDMAPDMPVEDMPFFDMDLPDAAPSLDMPQDMVAADASMGDDFGMNGQGRDMSSAGQDMAQNASQDDLAITSVSPSSAPQGEGLDLVILGEGFASGIEVSLDARKIGVIETGPERVLATAPDDLVIGTYDVIATNPNGASAILQGGFTVTDAAMPADMGMGDESDAPSNRADSAAEGCACGTQHTPAKMPPWGVFVVVGGVIGAVVRRRRIT